jgi:AraC-like DNA-binding protein
MDPLEGMLRGVRAHGAFILRLMLDPPWSMRVQDEAPLTVICMTQGSAVIIPDSSDGSDAIVLHAGDVALACGTTPYVFADAPQTSPQVVIHPGQRCTTLGGEDMRFEMSLGVRTWGNSADGVHRAVIGAYEGRSVLGARLLEALPEVAVLRSGEWDTPLVQLLAEECARDVAGQETFLDRLIDLVLIGVLRTWFDRVGNAPEWWYAVDDPVVGRAIRLMYNNPDHPWTVANLASVVGCSRAAFARKFTSLVGEPPIAFLTTWRMELATDLLRTQDATLSTVARRVGYGTPFALSIAFKRRYGVSPHAYRAAAVG